MIRLLISAILVSTATLVSADDGVSLKVALFKYVPSPEGIQKVVARHWSSLHPDVPVEFVSWDCYEQDPTPDLDVFETDAIFLDHLVQNNYVAPLAAGDLRNAADFFPFAVRGSMVDGQLYGIPRIACRPILFFRSGDAEIENAIGLRDLFYSFGASRNVAPQPPKNSGLLIDLSGGTTCACYYLDAVADISGNYQIDPALPQPSELQDSAIDNLRVLTLMAGTKQALYENWDGQRARWFAEGYGRGFVGWTERLSMIPEEHHKSIGVRELPLAGDDRTNLIFVDTLCLNPSLGGPKRQLALEFANVAASSAAVVESFLVEKPETGSPQYLLPVRKSVLADPRLKREAPLYEKLDDLLEDSPKAFRIDDDVRPWLESTKGAIRTRITTVVSE